MKLLADIVGAHKDSLDVRTPEEKAQGAPAVTVRVQELAESSIKLRAFVWTKDAGTSFPTLSDLRYETKKVFDRNGIEIPYPYRSIVMKHEETKYSVRRQSCNKQSYGTCRTGYMLIFIHGV